MTDVPCTRIICFIKFVGLDDDNTTRENSTLIESCRKDHTDLIRKKIISYNLPKECSRGVKVHVKCNNQSKGEFY